MNKLLRPTPPCKRRRLEKTERAAKVVFRVKGSGNPGVMYQGQKVIRGCQNCGSMVVS